MSKYAEFRPKKMFSKAEVKTIVGEIFNMLDGKPHNLAAILKPFEKAEPKPRTTRVKASSMQLDLPVKIMTKAEIKKAEPRFMRAPEPEHVRDQHAAGKLAHRDVVEHIRLVAALSAIWKWRQGKATGGHFIYAKAAGRFTQQGVAEVIWANNDAITVRSIWGNYRMENRKMETYTKTVAEWQKLRDELMPLALSPKHQLL